jgi:hypothetical protein
MEAPDRIDLARHRDLRGLERAPWVRRVLLTLLFVVPLLALLNVFGQRPVTSSAAGPAATFTVRAPERLRGGLLYQVRFDVRARRAIHQPTLVFSNGWWEELSLNAVVPDPATQAYTERGVSLRYGSLPTGGRLHGWISFQVNPTAVGRRSTSIELRDGTNTLARVSRSLTLFP